MHKFSKYTRDEFGEDFAWGVSTASYQIEGAHDRDGKGPSIWDEFTSKKKKIYKGQNGDIACDFYRRYEDDLDLMKAMNIKNFRFSLSWSRILPNGIGQINPKGIEYYDRLIDQCLERGITPWITLYHWDLPLALEQQGGWTNRSVVQWFSEYVDLCTKIFGDRVKKWIVLNEPMVYAGAGYFLGVHAPGKKGLGNFISAMHHSVLCQAEGGRIVRYNVPEAEIGTTFSCSHIEPYSHNARDINAAIRMDALLNRLCFEPLVGLGYPTDDLKVFRRIEKYMAAGDEETMQFDFDFIGIQNYTREIVRHSYLVPFLQSKIIGADKRNVKHTVMNWEVYPESIYHMLKKYSTYSGVKSIYVTENGAAFQDKFSQGNVHDKQRTKYLKKYIGQVLRAKKEGVNVKGYFVWTFTDNFEWAEGYKPRFGLVYTDFKTQERYLKTSGQWYANFLEGQRSHSENTIRL